MSSAIQRFLGLREDDNDDDRPSSDDNEGNDDKADASISPLNDQKALWSSALQTAKSSLICRGLFDDNARFANDCREGFLVHPDSRCFLP